MDSIANESAIRALVKTAVESYAVGFQSRHQAEVEDPEGTLNMKKPVELGDNDRLHFAGVN